EILYAIGAGGMVVGRGEYCKYPAEVLELEAVKSGQETNLEQVIALKPDVVVMTKMAQSQEHTEALEKAGIQTLVTDAQDIAGVHAAITLLGQVTGKTTEAALLSENMKAVFADVASKVDGRAAGTAYYEASPLQWGLWASASATFMDELGKVVGLANIFSDAQGWVEVSEEQVISRNPDYILTTAMYFGEGPLPDEEVMSRIGWQGITAIKENQVLNVDNDLFTVPGPRLAEALGFLYGYLYGSPAAAE
ncbi:MAG: helical backbone metal receptor, partial [Eubacteriales bacterium]|nr:helical backbone metal receptor [Eubacteriales bacterium]